MLRDTPVDVFPEFAQPKVEIQTMTFGLSAEETEELVTVPMEQSLQGIPSLDVIRSKSVPGLSQIVLLFDRGTDLMHARQVVDERVGTITPSLPTWAAPPVMIQPLSSTSRVMKIGLTSDSLSLMDMSIIAYWKIRARLLRVPGVANTPIWGERLKMQQLQIDPAKLKQHGVSLDAGHGRLRQRPRRRPAPVLGGIRSSGRAGSSTPRTSASTSSTWHRSSRRRTCRTCRSRGSTASP